MKSRSMSETLRLKDHVPDSLNEGPSLWSYIQGQFPRLLYQGFDPFVDFAISLRLLTPNLGGNNVSLLFSVSYFVNQISNIGLLPNDDAYGDRSLVLIFE